MNCYRWCTRIKYYCWNTLRFLIGIHGKKIKIKKKTQENSSKSLLKCRMFIFAVYAIRWKLFITTACVCCYTADLMFYKSKVLLKIKCCIFRLIYQLDRCDLFFFMYHFLFCTIIRPFSYSRHILRLILFDWYPRNRSLKKLFFFLSFLVYVRGVFMTFYGSIIY